MKRFRVNLKTFLGLAMSIQWCHAVTKLILGWFVGKIFGQETPNLNDPYIHCIVLPYYVIPPTYGLFICL